ncbi:hypothetical protein [Bradyrhizobium sp.]|uniref:hypothetical protein n=1 Tax=Bradyrhizobium sp. TaxID=376 RepID=UPI001D2FF23C|nr:hypothetical protein [Bradyrhizobium sp.]MBI5318852.1 hypothetical protein [Bradyrhizobium sp.]
MTTSARRRSPLRLAGSAALVACGWLTLLVVLTFAGPQKTIAVVGPQAQAIAAVVQAKGHILVAYDYVTIARSEETGFVGRLYAAGALLVLDADQAGGCSGLPPKRAVAKL